MGGSGSGSWYRWGSKATTESQHRVDIRWLKRKGYLQAGTVGELFWSNGIKQTGNIKYSVEKDSMRLYYSYRINGGEWQSVEQNIFFCKTPCNYGGYRIWFLCPKCLKRVAILYAVGRFFLCRHCYNLTYTSQQQSREYRLMHKTEKILAKLGAPNNTFNLSPSKPKYMHWKTYRRLKKEAESSYRLAMLAAEERFGSAF